jgi:hypothetical protein
LAMVSTSGSSGIVFLGSLLLMRDPSPSAQDFACRLTPAKRLNFR